MSASRDPHRFDRFFRTAIEGIVVALIVFSPWALGAVKPIFESLVMSGVAVLAFVWAAAALVRGEMTWRNCPIALIFAAIIVFTAAQLLPLPRAILGILSPKTLQLRAELIPAEPEADAANGQPLVATTDSHPPLSLFPHATRTLLLQLLTAFIMYAVVRNQIGDSASRRRIAWICLANGALLSLFALAHSFSAPQHVVYWSIPVDGAVFGPFVNRNDFPFYIDLCIGLGMGLLQTESRQHRSPRRGETQPWELWIDAFFSALQSPRILTVVLALAIMVVASVYSMSRGGVVSQLFAAAFCSAIWLRSRFQSTWQPAAFGGAAMVAVLLAAWFGVQPLEERFETLQDANAAGEERLIIWKPLVRALPEFPIFGTGGGTCEFVEPMHRTVFRPGLDLNIGFAHNEYLEAAVEGGLIRFSLTLALVGVILFRGWRYFRGKWSSRHDQALGLFWALLAIAAHSFFDFGVHIPAVALLTAVVAAFFMRLTDRESDRPVPVRRPTQAAIAAVFFVLIGMILVFEGWKGDRSERLRVAAKLCANSSEHRSEQFVYLQAAVRLSPDDAILHQTLGQAHLNAIVAGASRDEHIHEALQHLATARNLCPLIAHPHARLAEHRSDFRSPDPAIVYWERAIRMRPADPELWFACGAQHLADGRPEDAWIWWRRYLEVTDVRLPEILMKATAKIGVAEVQQKLLPDRPELLIAVAERLFPKPEDLEKRRPFLERAVAILAQSSDGPELRRRAQIQSTLGRGDDALASYAAALNQEPRQNGWRIEYAKLLRDRGKLAESLKEFKTALKADPDCLEAREWRDVVERELMLKEKIGDP